MKKPQTPKAWALAEIAKLKDQFNTLAANNDVTLEDRAFFLNAVEEVNKVTDLIQKDETQEASNQLDILSRGFNLLAAMKAETPIQKVYQDCGEKVENTYNKIVAAKI